MVWGAIIGAAATIGSQFLANERSDSANDQAVANSAVAWDRTKAGVEKSWNRTYGAYKRRYQDTTKDMRKAGLNPILAATGGFNVGSGASAQAATAQPAATHMAQPVHTDYTASAKSWAESQKIKKEGKLTLQKIKESLQNVVNMRASKKLITQQEKQAVQQVFNLQQAHEKMAREMSLLVDKADLTKEETINAQKLRQQIIVTTKRIEAETSKLKQIAKVYEGPIGQILAYMQEIMRSIGLPVAAAIIKKGR